MRRRACCHADRNAFRAVDQEIGDTARKNRGLLFGFIEIRHKIHDIFVQIRKQCLFRNLLESRLRIPHRGSRVTFDCSEVAVSVYKRKLFFKILRHDHKAVVDRTVPVRMVFPHGVADNSGAFPVCRIVMDAKLFHVVERSSQYRF